MTRIQVINHQVEAYKWDELLSEIGKAAHREGFSWESYLADLGEELNRRIRCGDVPRS